VPERLNGTVSKTVVALWTTVGSNPTLSAGWARQVLLPPGSAVSTPMIKKILLALSILVCLSTCQLSGAGISKSPTATIFPTPTATPVPVPFGQHSYTDRPDDFPGYHQIHALYVVLKDSTNKGRDLDGSMDENFLLMNQWFAEQTGGRSFILDSYHGGLDITYVELPITEKELLDYAYKTYYGQYDKNWEDGYYINSSLQDFLYRIDPPLFHRNKLYVAYIEILKNEACGDVHIWRSIPFAMLYPSATELRTGHMECYKYSNQSPDNQIGTWEYIVAHEIIHALGFPTVYSLNSLPPDYFHIDDPDVPCDIMGMGAYCDKAELDPNHNDYYHLESQYIDDLEDSPYLYP
jgi:hypothetical protein